MAEAYRPPNLVRFGRIEKVATGVGVGGEDALAGIVGS